MIAFPWVFHANFETGDITEWDSETDTGSQLDIAHYSDLAALPYVNCAPFTGAYCLRIVLSGGTADAFLTEADINIATNTTNHFSFNIWFSPDFAATSDDTVAILELQETGGANEAVFGFRIIAATNAVELGIGELAPTSFGNAIEKGVMYTVELAVFVENPGNNDGTIDIRVHREGGPSTDDVYATQVGSLDQGAITDGLLGVQDHLSTTTGTFLIDNFIQDDARIYPDLERFPEEVLLTKTAFVALGECVVDNISLLSGGSSDNVVTVRDADAVASINSAANMVAELKNTAANELVDPAGTPLNCRRGCYVSMTGSNPRALLKMTRMLNTASLIRDHGLHRKVV